MTNPKAIIVAWIGPSDRPMPPTIFWADKAALDGATDWTATRGIAPIGVTPVETSAEVLACFRQSLEPSMGTGHLLEITSWGGAGASPPITLDTKASKAFLASVIPCVGMGTAAAGYLESLQIMVNNASR